jgi:DNA-binding NarL/FixJ family response regulator
VSNKIKILLADDHRIVREGIRSLLEKDENIEVIGEAENGREAVQLARELSPDVILMDVAMPLLNGLEATLQIKRDCPEIKVLALSVHEDEEYIRQMLASGAMGYITKYSATDELLQAVMTVHRGEMVLSPAITRLVIEDYLRWADIQQDNPEKLTPREREVLQLIAEGHKNKEISDILKISIKTVKAHRNNLMQKLDLHSQGDLIRYAIQKKIIEL